MTHQDDGTCAKWYTLRDKRKRALNAIAKELEAHILGETDTLI